MIQENLQSVPQIPQKKSPKPHWIRSGIPGGQEYLFLKQNLKSRNISTVCQEAHCPNLAECWNRRTATMMILGSVCTRGCRFCNVLTGHQGEVLDEDEPRKVAEMVNLMNLRYVVITSVDRDDLSDFGAGQFVRVLEYVKSQCPDVLVEVLIPDFGANKECMQMLGKSRPFVIAHNLETVRRLTGVVRDRRATYDRSLEVLKFYKQNNAHQTTKSSLMLGLGENNDEIIETMKDLRSINVDILTLGQYLSPSRRHLPVVRYYEPEEFEKLKSIALDLGFSFVASGPMVRSSYHAGDYADYAKSRDGTEMELGL